MKLLEFQRFGGIRDFAFLMMLCAAMYHFLEGSETAMMRLGWISAAAFATDMFMIIMWPQGPKEELRNGR
jgi:hypothetical protein